jgi:hypothetical protein
MTGNVAELKEALDSIKDPVAEDIAYMWDQWYRWRKPKIAEITELRNYLFATDTSTTSNKDLPWKNSVTVPKLTQIRDNLHANYISTLFPNRKWLKWEGDTEEDQAKAAAIEAFMQDMVERSNFYSTISDLLLDYIDTGNVFATVEFENNTFDLKDGLVSQGYSGPAVRRISILDTVFNPLAVDYYHSPKINRTTKTIGELKKLAKTPGQEYWAEAALKSEALRQAWGKYSTEDWDKAIGYYNDGFGDIREYMGTQFVEILEFRGDYYDKDTGDLHENMKIIVVDRSFTAYIGPNDSWAGNRDQVHCPWRKRTDNLYGMGPLDNLVGMQYRIDHLENLKDDAFDLMVHPPLVIQGEVEPFNYGPGEEISIIGDGSVTELGKSLNGVVSAANEIAAIERKMEEFAGAPREAMGVRTPGEKTAFEVQSLEQAASRIFQEKITNFEINVLEPLLNLMLANARQYMSGTTALKIWDKKFDMQVFKDLGPDDLNGNGTIRPRGARHFGEQAIRIQNLTQLSNTKLWEGIQPHVSAEHLAKMVEDLFQLEDWGVIRTNQGMTETAERTEYANSLEQTVNERQAVPTQQGEMDV